MCMISRLKLLSLLAYSIVFLAIVNFLAIRGDAYYIFWYFDMPMHFLGGMTSLYLIFYVFYNKITPLAKLPVMYLLFGVLIIGLGWEIFEYIFLNWYAGQPFNLQDSSSDIFFDLAGGVFGILYIMRK